MPAGAQRPSHVLGSDRVFSCKRARTWRAQIDRVHGERAPLADQQRRVCCCAAQQRGRALAQAAAERRGHHQHPAGARRGRCVAAPCTCGPGRGLPGARRGSGPGRCSDGGAPGLPQTGWHHRGAPVRMVRTRQRWHAACPRAAAAALQASCLPTRAQGNPAGRNKACAPKQGTRGQKGCERRTPARTWCQRAQARAIDACQSQPWSQILATCTSACCMGAARLRSGRGPARHAAQSESARSPSTERSWNSSSTTAATPARPGSCARRGRPFSQK
jgi:hypothetical protein